MVRPEFLLGLRADFLSAGYLSGLCSTPRRAIWGQSLGRCSHIHFHRTHADETSCSNHGRAESASYSLSRPIEEPTGLWIRFPNQICSGSCRTVRTRLAGLPSRGRRDQGKYRNGLRSLVASPRAPLQEHPIDSVLPGTLLHEL